MKKIKKDNKKESKLKNNNFKRVLIVSDLHSGHIVGLTPPSWQTTEEQKVIWNFWKTEVEKLNPVHTLIVNGDAIDGRGEKSGGTELITTDRKVQVDMAVECLNIVDAKYKVVIAGTPYHVGSYEDWEELVAEKIGADKFSGHEWVSINGKIIDCKHFIQSSIIPYGRYTSVAREGVWNTLWNIEGGAPKSDIFVRSHVHAFNYCGNNRQLFIITPAMQAFGSKFGVKKCSGIVNIGFIKLDIYDDGTYTFDPILFSDLKLISNEPLVLQ